jgi:hypothetical protein
MNNAKWMALAKDAKLYSRKLITLLDPRSSASACTAQTEVKYTNLYFFLFSFL